MSDRGGSTMIEVTLAFLLGGVVGAGIALLYAPAAGEETRQKLKETTDRLRGQIRDKTEGMGGYVEEGVQKVKEFIDEKKADITAAYESGKEAYRREKAKL
ncbi:MAG: YtxH domain-containing protein [Deltaproteobacteria bacterium]|nr:YtxH domain-containing protein [Deltaproteobacteria bacterium]